MKEKFNKIAKVSVFIYNRFFDDQCPAMAASLAYSTLLTLVPLLIVSFSILSFFPIFKGTGEQLQNFVLQNFVAGSANIIANHLQEFLQQVTRLSWTNMIFLVFVALLMMYNMVHAFNSVWRVQMQRHLALSFIIYLFVLLLSPILLGTLMLLTSYVASLSLVSSGPLVDYIKLPVVKLLPYITAFITFTFFNWVLPSTRVKFWAAAIAGLVTTFLFELAKFGFGLYLQYFPTYRLLYGALATIPLFLVWMYVSWLIILFGALLCRCLALGVE